MKFLWILEITWQTKSNHIPTFMKNIWVVHFKEPMFLSHFTNEEINSIINTYGDTASGWDDRAPRSVKLFFHISVFHYGDVIMGAIASQITSLTIVYSIVYSFWCKQNYYPSHGLFEESDVLSIYYINKCSLGMFCYRLNFGLLPDIFENFFTNVSHVHEHHTTSQCKFHVRASRTICVDKSIWYRGTILSNQMKNNITNSSNLNVFRTSLVLFLRGSWVTPMWQALFMRLCTSEFIYWYFHQYL